MADRIPAPLLDRMEVINLSGYVLEEKVAIAKDYLIPEARKNAGLTAQQVRITPTAIATLITNYCREAGVRNLQKHIDKILRKVAFKIVDSKKTIPTITPENLREYVGLPPFQSDRYYQTPIPGVVMGLAWTAMGGATLYVETIVDKLLTKPELHVTGQLGDVMKESTSIAYAFAKSFLEQVDPGNRFFETVRRKINQKENKQFSFSIFESKICFSFFLLIKCFLVFFFLFVRLRFTCIFQKEQLQKTGQVQE
jgi:Lon-like ATP-dependent protease